LSQHFAGLLLVVHPDSECGANGFKSIYAKLLVHALAYLPLIEKGFSLIGPSEKRILREEVAHVIDGSTIVVYQF
jgi:hypothetical protein